jgi:hypothetical protein
MEVDSIDVEDGLKMTVSVWKMTVSMWEITISMSEILSLCGASAIGDGFR